MKRVLFLCTGNSARSQMAEALLKHLGGGGFEVYSAGTKPQSQVNPFAIEVLKERGIPTDGLHPKLVNEYINHEIDLVVTVCDNAKQTCPHFPGAKRMEHWSLEDPAAFQGSYEEILFVFRGTLEEIEKRIRMNILSE
ncbi:MAG: arsenate reductase ArsC [Candidatus Thorarchaeota archaeon]|nr:arsenate reductase ArsC [Candidatus Thorarchaeota archaeon]